MKIAVLGAGVSGLTAARLLSEKGHNVTVYEKTDNPGGLAKTRFVKSYLYDPHGGHILILRIKRLLIGCSRCCRKKSGSSQKEMQKSFSMESMFLILLNYHYVNWI
jgi:protoporphyrinogen oxidase